MIFLIYFLCGLATGVGDGTGAALVGAGAGAVTGLGSMTADMVLICGAAETKKAKAEMKKIDENCILIFF